MRRALLSIAAGILLWVPASAAFGCDDPNGCGDGSTTTSAAAYTVDAGATTEFMNLTNRERANAGLPALTYRGNIAEVAGGHSIDMAKSRSIYHNDAYFSSASKSRLGLKAAGENVGMGGSPSSIHAALMNSSGHRANILSGSFSVAGFAAVRDDGGTLYVTQNFGTPSSAPAAAAPTAPAPAPKPAPAPAPKPAAAPKPAPKPAPAPKPVPVATTAAPVPVTVPTVELPVDGANGAIAPVATEDTIPERVLNVATAAATSPPGPLAYPAVILLAAIASTVFRRIRSLRDAAARRRATITA